MPNEMVFTVNGTTAVPATPVSLVDAGLREREHLQEWVLEHPQILGDDVKIVSFEFGRWTNTSGAVEKDRLDVLGLDVDGQLVVVELKRDKAPDTVDMQALKYAALASRFTREDLDTLHASYLSKKSGQPVSREDAAAALDEWASITEESLRLPRLLLMAAEFPRTVTATVVFLHQQLGLDIRLLVFQAYRTADDVLLTVSQHYPPPDVEEFVLSPEVNEAKQQRTTKQTRKREATTVSLLLAGDVIEPGAPLTFRCPIVAAREEVDAWIAELPARGRAEWQDDPGRPLVWEVDGQPYSPTGLAARVLKDAVGRTSAVQGPICWVDADGATLVELAETVTTGSEVPIEVHLAKLSPELAPVFDALDKGIRGLGTDVVRQSRIRGLKYYRDKKMLDLVVYAGHLSLYIRRLRSKPDDPRGLIVTDKTPRYVHAQVRQMADVADALDLIGLSYAAA